MSRSVGLLLGMLLALIVIGLASAARPQDEHWLCQTFYETAVSGKEAQWSNTRYAFEDMPSDLGRVPLDLLYVDPEKTSAYYLMYSPSRRELWVWPFIDFESDGTPAGTHNFCMPRIYSLRDDE